MQLRTPTGCAGRGGCLTRRGALLALAVLAWPHAAPAVTPTVVTRQFGNVTEGALWWELHEIGSILDETWLWGSTNQPGGEGALLWAEPGLKLRASDLVVNDHPLDDLGIAVGVQALGRGFGAGAEGLVLQGVLRCADDASLDGRQAVLRCAGNECSYLLSSYDEMQLGDALLTPSGVADVACTRAGEVVALLLVRGGAGAAVRPGARDQRPAAGPCASAAAGGG